MAYSAIATELNSISKILSDSNLQAYYRLESGSLTTDSKNSNTLTNSNSVSESIGVFGGGADFGTANTNKSLATSNTLNIDGGSMSMVGWFKMRTEIASSYQDFVCQINNTSHIAFWIRYNYNGGSRQLEFTRYKDTGASVASKTITLGTSDWYHLALVFNSTRSALTGFVNGVKVIEISASGTSTTAVGNGFAIGSNRDGFAYASIMADDVAVFNRALDYDEVRSLAGYSSAAVEIEKSIWKEKSYLKGYWRFEETSGTNVADSSGNTHNGTASSTSILNNSGGVLGMKGLFNGTSDKVTITDHSDLKPTTAFTVGMWIKTNSTAFSRPLFCSAYASSFVSGYYFNYQGATTGVIEFVSGKNTGSSGSDYAVVTSSTAIWDDNWHLIIGAWSGSYLFLYVDGKYDGAVAWANAPVYQATNYIRLGCGNSTGTDNLFFQGSLDDVFVLNGVVLNCEQVKELYEGRKPGENYRLPSTSVLYHFNGNSKDFSDNTYGGTDTSITYSLANGKFGQGASFNGSSSKIVLTAGTPTKPSSNFTIMAWVKTNLTSNGVIFQSYSYNTLPAGIQFWVLSSGGIYGVSGRNTGTVSGTDWRDVGGATNIKGTNWYFVAFTYDGSYLRLYVNGKVDGVVSWTYSPGYAGTTYARIGCQNTAGTDNNFFNGQIDELVVLSSALDQTQIRKIYLKSIGKLQ